MTLTFTLLICLCGGLGAGLRYLLDTLVKARWQVDLPLSTMIINLLAGCCWPQDCWAASPPSRQLSTRCWSWPSREGIWQPWAIYRHLSSCHHC